jgi:hypothetical protein
MTTEIPTHLYIGRREAICAELCDQYAIYPGKYLVVPVGEATWDAEGANSKATVKNLIADARRAWPNIIVCYV